MGNNNINTNTSNNSNSNNNNTNSYNTQARQMSSYIEYISKLWEQLMSALLRTRSISIEESLEKKRKKEALVKRIDNLQTILDLTDQMIGLERQAQLSVGDRGRFEQLVAQRDAKQAVVDELNRQNIELLRQYRGS